MKVPMNPPNYQEVLLKLGASGIPRLFQAGVSPAPNGTYYHWDKLRHLESPEGLSSEEWWAAVKVARNNLYKRLPLDDKDGSSFKYLILDEMLEMLHRIDRDAVGSILVGDRTINEQARDTYLARSLFEEAIRSSQLEGASTTRKEAKSMLQSGRKPKDKNEQMIFNNFFAMQDIIKKKDETMSIASILELHQLLTSQTLKDPQDEGQFRTTNDIVIEDAKSGRVLHHPPKASEIHERMESLCAFANEIESKPFIHPVIKAIILHFWLAYVHPFADGNGRTARALFYWSMIRSGYWVCEFVSISKILQTAPAEYTRSYLYVETDDCDATYFIIYQLETIVLALEELYGYLKKISSERQSAMRLIKRSQSHGKALNVRQIWLLDDAMQNPDHQYSFSSHKAKHNVSYQTARNDLHGLRDLGLLEEYRLGRVYYYEAPENIQALLPEL